MNIVHTAIPGVKIVETAPFIDHRGAFFRLFCARELSEILGGRHIAQINYSRTETVGAIRGLHYQHPPCAEIKLVRCLSGRIFDVALDLRKESPTFLKWHAEELTPGNAWMLVIPEGCAHGFQALQANSEILYLVTAAYAPAMEAGVRFDDPACSISWPLPVADLSEKDANHPLLDNSFSGIPLVGSS